MSFWSCECIGPQEGEKHCPCVIAMYVEKKERSYEDIMQELADLIQELNLDEPIPQSKEK